MTRLLAVAVFLALGPGTTAASAQSSPGEITCVGGVQAQAFCTEAALGLQAARGAIGLALAQGSDLPGSASTLGKRLGSTPRIALFGRAAITRAELPVMPGAGPGTRGETRTLPSLRAGLALGLFDGFNPAPTVGGILSVDLLADAGLVFVGADEGYDGSVAGGGVGIRVGAFRESFTLPGVSVTAARRWTGTTTFGLVPDDIHQHTRAELSTTVTSVRAVVGKEFFAWGLSGGVGWERYEGDGELRTAPPAEPSVVVEAPDLQADRLLLFGGLSYNVLILQLSLEGGWAEGFDAVEGRPPPPGDAERYDPTSGSFFAGVSFRLVL